MGQGRAELGMVGHNSTSSDGAGWGAAQRDAAISGKARCSGARRARRVAAGCSGGMAGRGRAGQGTALRSPIAVVLLRQ